MCQERCKTPRIKKQNKEKEERAYPRLSTFKLRHVLPENSMATEGVSRERKWKGLDQVLRVRKTNGECMGEATPMAACSAILRRRWRQKQRREEKGIEGEREKSVREVRKKKKMEMKGRVRSFKEEKGEGRVWFGEIRGFSDDL